MARSGRHSHSQEISLFVLVLASGFVLVTNKAARLFFLSFHLCAVIVVLKYVVFCWRPDVLIRVILVFSLLSWSILFSLNTLYRRVKNSRGHARRTASLIGWLQKAIESFAGKPTRLSAGYHPRCLSSLEDMIPEARVKNQSERNSIY